MNIVSKITSKSTQYSALLKPRVGKVVVQDGVYYSNISGANGDISDTTNWIKIFNSLANSSLIISKDASSISGVDPTYVLNLSTSPLSDFPASVKAYVDINGDGSYISLEPIQYDPVAKVLYGMNSPTDFPNQRIKVVVL